MIWLYVAPGNCSLRAVLHEHSFHFFFFVANATLFFYLFLFHTWVWVQVHKTIIRLLGVIVVDGLEEDWKLVCRGDELF